MAKILSAVFLSFLFLSCSFALQAAEPQVQTLESGEHSFGMATDTDGDVLVVGAPHTQVGDADSHGQAHVFVHAGGSWSEADVLLPGDGEAFARFADDVAVDGETIVIGAPRATDEGLVEAGAVYVFERNDAGEWNEVARLSASDPTTMARFGSDVDIDGNRVIVSAPRAGEELGEARGAAYIFERDAATSTWQEAVILDRELSSDYATSVALHGDQAAVVANGRVFIYQRDATGWPFLQALVADQQRPFAEMGDGVLVLSEPGAESPDTTGPMVGHVDVFEFVDDRWDHVQMLTASMPSALDQFGYAMDVRDGVIAITNGYEYNARVELFTRDDTGTWTRKAEVSDGRPIIDKSVAVSAQALAHAKPEPFTASVDVYAMSGLIPGLDAGDDDDGDDGNGDDSGNGNGSDDDGAGDDGAGDDGSGDDGSGDDGGNGNDGSDDGSGDDGTGDDGNAGQPGAGDGGSAGDDNAGDDNDGGSDTGGSGSGGDGNTGDVNPGGNGGDGGGGTFGWLLALAVLARHLKRQTRFE